MSHTPVILLVSPYWKEEHRWMVSSVKLAELWQRMGYRVVVVCMGKSNSVTQVSEALEIHTRADYFLPDPWNYGISFGFGRYVARLHRTLQPDVTVVNKVLFWSSFSLLSLRVRGVRAVLLTDALVGMTWWPRGTLPRFCAALYAWTAGWLLLRVASCVVFFHPQPPALLRTLGIQQRSRVIPTGIDPAPYTQNRSIAEHSAPVTITYVGRLESVKGVEDFLVAVDALLDEGMPLSVQIAGYARRGHPLVERYGNRVRFLGLREDVSQVLAQSDLFVLPSYSEGLSNALMEAMASGCACIATRVGGNTYLLPTAVIGLLYTPGDVEELRSHIRRLAQDPEKRFSMGQAARARIQDVFAWEHVATQYRTLFTSQT